MVHSSLSRRLDYAGHNVTFFEELYISLTGSNDGCLDSCDRARELEVTRKEKCEHCMSVCPQP